MGETRGGTDHTVPGSTLRTGEEITRLARRARVLVARLEAAGATTDADPGRVQQAIERLSASVLRPLELALRQPGGPEESHATGGADEPSADERVESAALLDADMWDLAIDLSGLAISGDAPAAVVEAAAALQHLVCASPVTGVSFDTSRVATLRALHASRTPGIVVSPDGPYLATNVDLVDHLDVAVAAPPLVALCRCGGSAIKPWCDGSHAANGFSDAKDPRRVPDHLDVYEGRQVVVSDNRGMCAHAGFCTDRVPGAFRAGTEPFVAPSGARMDEIVRAVRACPSGALGLRLLGNASPAQADQQRDAAVEISRDGPYRVRGSVTLTDHHGGEVRGGDGSSTEHYSLCRCGHSLNKPFCSGMHWYVDFKDPPTSPEPTVFEWAGGLPALSRVTRLFFEKYVPEDPLLAPVFAAMAVDLPERVAAWLAEVFGGPSVYSATYGDPERMRSSHRAASITEAQRARWVALLSRCADEAGLPSDPEFRSAFASYLEWESRAAVATSTEA